MKGRRSNGVRVKHMVVYAVTNSDAYSIVEYAVPRIAGESGYSRGLISWSTSNRKVMGVGVLHQTCGIRRLTGLCFESVEERGNF